MSAGDQLTLFLLASFTLALLLVSMCFDGADGY